jgi:sugar O-acyltransferase (sialic acid O-acetyltransferase NeuD family)
VKDLLIYGAGDLGREYLWYLKRHARAWKLLGFLDDNLPADALVSRIPVLGGIDWLKTHDGAVDVICAVAMPNEKKRVVSGLVSFPQVRFPVLVHPDAVVAESALLGGGTVVGPGCVVSVDARLGAHVLVNMGALVCHDVSVGDYAELAPACALGGRSAVGEGVSIGIGSRVLPGVTVGARSVLGAGAVAVRDIPPGCTAVGVPARPLTAGAAHVSE